MPKKLDDLLLVVIGDKNYVTGDLDNNNKDTPTKLPPGRIIGLDNIGMLVKLSLFRQKYLVPAALQMADWLCQGVERAANNMLVNMWDFNDRLNEVLDNPHASCVDLSRKL